MAGCGERAVAAGFNGVGKSLSALVTGGGFVFVSRLSGD